jgi:hypothetical protein
MGVKKLRRTALSAQIKAVFVTAPRSSRVWTDHSDGDSGLEGIGGLPRPAGDVG